MSDDNNPTPPGLAGVVPPSLLPEAQRPSGGLRKVVAVLLGVFLIVFLADAVVSLADDSLNLFFRMQPLMVTRIVLSLLAGLLAVLIYGLMVFTPMIPKRVFVPLTLSGVVAQLAVLPCLIYHYDRLLLMAWGISLVQVILGVAAIGWARRGFNFRWPFFPEDRLGAKGFSWFNLIAFPLLNGLVFLPVAVVYVLFCASLAVGHFSDGFLTLRPAGLSVWVKKFVRADGKMIQLVPMAHVGDAAFYRKLTQSFPTNALILMEGVTDEQHLLTNKISYKRMAAKLGLSEQKQEFQLKPEQVVRADVDIAEFNPGTIALLNVVMRIHAQGLNPATLQDLMHYPVTPEVQAQLIEDLVTKRNQHLLGEIRTHLAESDLLIVPWGAAHMPGIASEIQKTGFRLITTNEYTVIHFGGAGNHSKK